MIPPKVAPYLEGAFFAISWGWGPAVGDAGRRGMLRRRVILIFVDYPDRSGQCRHGHVSSGEYAVYDRESGWGAAARGGATHRLVA
jgi:hypothetical protein